ncbi:tetratricopeptide repeat domain-containing protein [Ditylenchus destructor]|uniref:Tetratricopeptide repeat domain-containing protein n=1 Tax=Ditylenchus destructor TaxID=166010 RepID=A0AAD4N8J7_9BILA|nr:tetratricopeptide repeat domain-containing protein [Ditylenchus destructor]
MAVGLLDTIHSARSENRSPHNGGVKEEDDPYGGFNDYDHAYDLENIYNDKEFVQAVSRSSYGRRPITGARATAVTPATNGVVVPPLFRYGMPPSAAGGRFSGAQSRMMTGAGPGATALGPRSALASRMRTGTTSAVNRPMTAVRAAGYTSAGRKSTFEGVKGAHGVKSEDRYKVVLRLTLLKCYFSSNEKVRKQEAAVNELLKESVYAADQKNFKKALEKAKEAGRKERAAVKFRTLHNLGEPNLDLTLVVLINLAQQHLANGMHNEALHVYHTIVKNKAFANAGRLKVNIGNIYFKKKDFPKAIKYYRTKFLNNIGVTLVKLGKYEDALAAFEDCLDASGDYETALNLVLAAYCLEDAEKMREAFQRLVDIPLMIDEEVKDPSADHDILALQLLANDTLNAWERKRKQQAERTILIAAKIISQSIASSFSEGYAWCVETIKQSVYASLAIELEMNKALDLLKTGELDAAIEALHSFHNKETKVASAASNNLCMISIMRGPENLEEATQQSEHALSHDRYNANALVNRGNIYFLQGEPKLAQQYYKEALQVEASCVQAIYNFGLVCRHLGDLEEAKRCFFKLNEMLLNNVQVLTQLAAIYEQQEDTAQAIDLFTQASNLAPTDPAILNKLSHIYEAEGDKSQAFQCHYDSYRYFPPSIDVIKWLGNYYLYAQFAEKAVNYFEKAALMEPNNIEWQLLIASCQRRSGNFQKAMQQYKQIHRRLKFLVQLCKDLRMTVEEKEFSEKLKRLEKVNQLRQQRDSGQGNRTRHSANANLYAPLTTNRPSSSRGSTRNSPNNTARALLYDDAGDVPYRGTKKDINASDLSYKDPVGPGPYRPITMSQPGQNMNGIFDNDDIGDLLPE